MSLSKEGIYLDQFKCEGKYEILSREEILYHVFIILFVIKLINMVQLQILRCVQYLINFLKTI